MLCAAALLIVVTSAVLIVRFSAKHENKGDISAPISDNTQDLQPDTNVQQPVDSDINANNSVVEDPIISVQKWDDLTNMGVCCELKDAPAEIANHRTDDQKAIFFDIREINRRDRVNL